MSNTSPAYMLIFRETTPERYAAMSKDELRQALRNWNAWCDELAAAGKLRAGNPLFPEARVVSGAAVYSVVDGPFAEAKERIGVSLLLDAATLVEATEIARRCPNLPFGMEVEIRTVAGGCHLARSLGLSTMREPEAAPSP